MNKIKRIISATLVGIMIIPSAVSAFPTAPVENINPIIQTIQLREAANKAEEVNLPSGKYEAMPLIDENDVMNNGIKALWENGKFKYTIEEYNKMLGSRRTDNNGLLNVEIGVSPYYEVEIKDNKANLTVSYVNDVMGEDSPEEYGLVKINDDKDITYKNADGKLQSIEILDEAGFELDPVTEEYEYRITQIRLENVPISKPGDANQFIYLENARYVRCYSTFGTMIVDAKPAKGDDPTANKYGIFNFDLNKMVLVESTTPGLNRATLQEKINEAKAIEQGKKTEEAFSKLKAAIKAAEETLKIATDQEALNQGVTTLKAAVEAFKTSEDVKLPAEDGIYKAPVKIMQADNPGKESMANGAIEHTAKVVYSGDKVTIELTFKGMDLKGFKGHLTNLFYFKNNQNPRSGGQAVETKVEKTFTDTGMDGQNKEFPQVFSFTIDRNLFEASDSLWIRVWVDVMDLIGGGTPGAGAQEAKIVIDKTNLPKEEPLKKEELTNLIDKAKKIEQGKKTDEAFNTLKAAITSAEGVLNSATEQTQLDEAVKTLKAAVETFNNSPNVLQKEALTKEIASAKEIVKGKKTDEAFSKLKAAIASAEETLKTATDQEALDQGVATLKAAVETFNNSPDVLKKEALTKEIASAKEIVKGKKTDEAFSKLQAAIKAAEETLKTATDQEALDQGVATLKAAVEAFNNSPDVLKKEALTKEITDAKAIAQGKKTEEAFSKLQVAITAAEKVLGEATEQTQLDEAVTTLKAAVETFNNSPDVLKKEALTKEIAAAKEIVKGNKKVEEYNILQSVIAEAEKVLKEATDQEDLDKEVTTLKAAVEAFKASEDVKLPAEDGIYLASVEIGNASNPRQKSMANGAIDHVAKLILKEGKAKVELTFKGLDLNGMKGHLTNLFTFENNQDPKTGGQAVETKVEKKFMDMGMDGQTSEFPQVFSFTMDKNLLEASEFIWCRVWVDVMDGFMGGPGKGAQEARIIINKEHLKKVVLNTEALTNEIEVAKKIEQGKKTDEAFSKLQAAIKAAEEVLNNATDQEVLDQGVTTLKAAVEAFNNSPDVLKKEALTNEIEVAKKIEQGKKTDEAFSKLQAAIKAAEETLKNATDQETLDQGVATLKAAVKAFSSSPDKKVTPQPTPQPKPNYPSYPSYPSYPTYPRADKGTKNTETKLPAKEVKREAQNNKADNFTDIEGHWAKEAIKYVVNKGYFQGVNDREFAPNKGITRGQFVTVLGRILNIDKTSFKSNNFKDVKTDAYYAPYVAWAESVGITKGRGSGSFDPDKEITREEMAVMMVKFLKVSGKKLNAKGTASAFKDDVNIESWAKDAVVEMAKLGLVKGMEDGSFSPKTQFTRAQVAQILYNIDKN